MIRVLAWVYVIGCSLWVVLWLIKQADRDFWAGVIQGGLIALAYVLFLCAISYLTWGPIWR